MSTLGLLVILCGIALLIWLILILYRGRLQRQEEESVHFGSGSTAGHGDDAKPHALMMKVQGLSKPIWIFGIIWVLLGLASLALWVYRGLMT